MFNEIKNSLKIIFTIGFSLALLPTIADIFGHSSQERNNILSLLTNYATVIQFIGIFLTSLPTIIYFLILSKEKRSKNVLKLAVSNDPIWDIESLKYHTRFIFYKVQCAWKDETTDALKGYATPEFISWFKEEIKNKTTNKTSAIDVSQTRIVYCQDFVENEMDKFAGYLKVNIMEDNGKEKLSKKEFSEIYHFVRFQNDWLLNKVAGGGIWNLFFVSSKHEE